MKLCSVEGCDNRHHAKGLCAVHRARMVRAGRLGTLPRPSVSERFGASFWIHSRSGCWTWRGLVTTTGYGLFSVDGRYRLAHRWSYETYVKPIPDGMHLDHLCRNRACVNPKHLDVVTNRENVMRGMSPTAVIRRQGICKNGHDLVGDNIYVPPKSPQHRACRTCRKRRSAEAYARKVEQR